MVRVVRWRVNHVRPVNEDRAERVVGPEGNLAPSHSSVRNARRAGTEAGGCPDVEHRGRKVAAALDRAHVGRRAVSGHAARVAAPQLVQREGVSSEFMTMFTPELELAVDTPIPVPGQA